MKTLAGFALGLVVVLAIGAAVQQYDVTVRGDFEKVGIFQPAFSGVSPDGQCYLAVTDTRTGKTQVFGITKEIQKKLSDKPFQMSRDGGLVVELQ